LHSFFDGLGLGAEDTVNAFFGLLGAVIGHKSLDGFALGIPLFFADLPRFQIIFALVFSSLMTPIGIALGLVLTQYIEGGPGKLVQAIILSVSAGSFLFISLIELLPSGLEMEGYLHWKLLAIAIGWGLMAVLALPPSNYLTFVWGLLHIHIEEKAFDIFLLPLY